MKRREFLVSTAGLVGAALPLAGRSENRPCPPGTLSVSGGTSAQSSCSSALPSADWLSRSSGPGVVWAHDFSEPDEAAQFMGGPNAVNRLTHPMRPTVREETLFGSSRVLVNRSIGTTFAKPLNASTKGAEDKLYLVDASAFPDPATGGEYQVLIGGEWTKGQTQESVMVIGKSGNELTVKRAVDGDPASRQVGEGCGHAPSMRWKRIMAAFPAGDNGKSTPDIGIKNGFTPRHWAPSTDTGTTHYRWRTGWWGHESYRQLYNAKWPVAPYSDTYGRTFTDTFDGTEFWIQFRMLISASRFNSPRGKLLYLQQAHRSNAQQLYFVAHSPSRQFRPACNFGGNPSFDMIEKTAAWDYPVDEWATYMIHMKPGRNGVAETLVEVFAARQNEGSFRTLLSAGGLAWPYHTSSMDKQAPPAFNCFEPCSYPNAYVGSGSSGPPTSTNTVEFTQVILSKDPIACPKPIA